MPAQTHKATGKPLLALLVAILAATLFSWHLAVLILTVI